MGAKIIWFLVAVLIIIGGVAAYQHYKETRTAESGGYQCKGCLSPNEEAKFQREDHGETADGQSDRKTETARQAAADAARTPTQMPDQQQPDQTYTVPQAKQPPVQSGMDQGNPGYGRSGALTSMPTADSQTANAPNGMRFAGSGNYQWYRQGSLTWRVNTASGQSCIIYATMEEWRKQIVLSHGCGTNA